MAAEIFQYATYELVIKSCFLLQIIIQANKFHTFYTGPLEAFSWSCVSFGTECWDTHFSISQRMNVGERLNLSELGKAT